MDIDDLANRLSDLSDADLDAKLAEIRANRRQRPDKAPRKTVVKTSGATVKVTPQMELTEELINELDDI